MEILDLHGVRHSLADDLTRRFLNFTNLPCQIITGNSSEMRTIVCGIVNEYKWFYHEKDSYNYGTLIITEDRI